MKELTDEEVFRLKDPLGPGGNSRKIGWGCTTRFLTMPASFDQKFDTAFKSSPGLNQYHASDLPYN